VSFGLPGMVFYWELATLLDIMLLGTGSRCAPCWGFARPGGAGPADALGGPSPAADGSTEEVGLGELRVGDGC